MSAMILYLMSRTTTARVLVLTWTAALAAGFVICRVVTDENMAGAPGLGPDAALRFVGLPVDDWLKWSLVAGLAAFDGTVHMMAMYVLVKIAIRRDIRAWVIVVFLYHRLSALLTASLASAQGVLLDLHVAAEFTTALVLVAAWLTPHDNDDHDDHDDNGQEPVPYAPGARTTPQRGCLLQDSDDVQQQLDEDERLELQLDVNDATATPDAMEQDEDMAMREALEMNVRE
jgi:hypothetical protein